MAKIEDYNFNGKKAIVRVDFNVPLDENGNITDDTRIRGALPTLKKILADGGSLIIMSHMGKPKGKVNPKLSLLQIRDAVAKAIGRDVKFAPDCAKAQEAAKELKPGEVLLLENLRFYPPEQFDSRRRKDYLRTYHLSFGSAPDRRRHIPLRRWQRTLLGPQDNRI